MEKVYEKLVRDRIPEIIEKSGNTCYTRILAQEEYLKMLDKKLTEELSEYQESKSLEELADLLEVMQAVAKARGADFQQVEEICLRKRQERGGFEKRVLLQRVVESV